MAITLTEEPTIPCFSKNVIAYKVHTSLDLPVIGNLFFESAPYSETYEFVSSIKALPDPDGYCYFYLQDLLEVDVLRYSPPVLGPFSKVDEFVCRRFKMDFYEFDADIYILHEQVLNATNAVANIQIDNLTTGQDYLAIADKERSELRFSINGFFSTGFALDYEVEDEWWFQFNAAWDFGRVDNVLPQETIRIYETPEIAITTSAVRFALLGGIEFDRFGVIQQSGNLWGQEDYDLIVDDNGNFVGV